MRHVTNMTWTGEINGLTSISIPRNGCQMHVSAVVFMQGVRGVCGYRLDKLEGLRQEKGARRRRSLLNGLIVRNGTQHAWPPSYFNTLASSRRTF